MILLVALTYTLPALAAALPAKKDTLNARLDLINVKNDKVTVSITGHPKNASTLTYRFAKIIPGTYAVADYGRYVENIKAFDKKGNELEVIRKDTNTVLIPQVKSFYKLTYLVNDTYDIETGGDVFSSKENQIFSPAGTNILAGEQFTLNMCGFVGYFEGAEETPYKIVIDHPATLYGATALIDTDPSAVSDLFRYSRFSEVVDNPIMYSKPDTASFNVGDMDVLISLYAPKKNISAKDLLPALQKTIVAQKKYLGSLNTTKKYAVLAYLTDMGKDNAKGIGALEHNTSTSAVFRESMTSSDLVHVISHEFFHTVAPLKIHSREIQFFNFAKPVMSEHLWFYEGCTEYFSNLFQVNQGLITEDTFLDEIAGKVNSAKEYNDSLSFTRMSKHVIDPTMKEQYPNVYMKGALMAMCLDIIMRENSKGERSLLSLQGELSRTYGPDKPFNDEDLIPEITKLTYPEVGDFLVKHVVEGKPIVYADYLKRVGVVPQEVPIAEPIVFMVAGQPYIGVDDSGKRVVVSMPDNNNAFFNNLGIKNGDIIVKMNGLDMVVDENSSFILAGYDLPEDGDVSMTILRDGKTIDIKGKVKKNYTRGAGYRFKDKTKTSLKQAWLKG